MKAVMNALAACVHECLIRTLDGRALWQAVLNGVGCNCTDEIACESRLTRWLSVDEGCVERMSVRVKAGVARCQVRMSGQLNASVMLSSLKPMVALRSSGVGHAKESIFK